MSRLYYPPAGRTTLAGGNGLYVDPNDALKKVAKLVPGELLTGYMGLISLSMNVENPAVLPWLFVISFILCLVLTPIYLQRMADAGKPKRNHLIVSTVAFVIWAYFVSGQQVLPDWHDTAVATFILVVFSLVSTVIPMNR